MKRLRTQHVRANDLSLVKQVSVRGPRHVGGKIDDHVIARVCHSFTASVREHLLHVLEGSKPLQTLSQPVHLRKRVNP